MEGDIREMVVYIEFFGAQRVVAGTASLGMPVTAETRVHDALDFVRERYPGLHLDDGMTLVTVNHETAPLDRVLRANDTVSFLPHISGG